MRYINYILFLLVVSCQSEFNSVEQAKNEVNKQGLRDGRWVDYYTSSGDWVNDLSKGYDSYSLGEFEDGRLVGTFRIYDSKSMLISENIPFEGETQRFEKALNLQELMIKQVFFYHENGKLLKEVTKNKKGDWTTIKTYRPENGEVKMDYKNDYYDSGLIKSSSGFHTLEDKTRINFYLKFNTATYWDDNLEKEKSVQEAIESIIKKECDKRNIEYSVLINPEDKRVKPYAIDFFVENSDTIQIEQIILNEIQRFNELKRKKQASGGGNVRCDYCGIVFEKLNGYVRGLGLTTVKKYSNAISDLKMVQALGYDNSALNQLRQSYNRGTWLCSRRCVQDAGLRFGDI